MKSAKYTKAIWASVLALAVVTALTIPFMPGSMAKYAASATATASARVAAWGPDVQVTNWSNKTILIRKDTGGAALGPASYAGQGKYVLDNVNSEVTAEFDFSYVRLVGGQSAAIPAGMMNVSYINSTDAASHPYSGYIWPTQGVLFGCSIPNMPLIDPYFQKSYVRPDLPANTGNQFYEKIAINWTAVQVD